MTPRFRYPRFEENQVLSFQHLNQLAEFLEGEDRLSRRALIGAGVAYGLALEHSPRQGIRVGRGAALTTNGSLCHLEQELLFVAARVYRDPAGYPPFHGGGAEASQTILWELLEASPTDSTAVTALTGNAGANFLAGKAALLYLEVITADLDTCIDNHCINQGKELRGVWRVLLARRTDLAAIRQLALDARVPWPAWTLDELRAERLLLQSADVLSHAALSTRGLDFVRQTRTRLLPAIQESLPLYGALLDAAPQTTADALRALSTGLDAWLASLTAGHRLGWQHGLDHIRHLYRAWAEFVEAAFGFTSEPAPLREPFPRHVLLGSVPTSSYGEPDFLRHYFTPSPTLTLGGRDRELCRHRFMRLITMAATFGLPANRGVRITPGAALDHVLDEWAVPFYYDPNALLGWWNAEATWRNRGRRLPCYHRESLATDPAARDPLRFPADKWEFYRIEGHQGRNRREVEQALDGLRRQYQLAFDVVTVTFGSIEPETTHCLCELEEIKTLYRVSADEMRCHISRLLEVLGGLLKPATTGAAVFDKVVLSDGAVNLVLNLEKVQFLAFGPAGVRAAVSPDAATAALKSTASAASPAAAAASGITHPALAATAGTTQDFRTVHLDNLHITYAVIPAVLYPFLTPEALVNGLARELMGRLTEADAQLEATVEQFNADQFRETIQAARNKASDLTDALANRVSDVDPDVLEQREMLRRELLLFLANCVPTRLVQIAILFAQVLERIRNTPTLASFLRQHPGLEHLGGVPKGGTFVLVCGQPTAKPTPSTGQGTTPFGDFTAAAAEPTAASGPSHISASAANVRSAKALSESLLLKTYGYYQPTRSIDSFVNTLAAAASLAAQDKSLLTENYKPSTGQTGPAVIDLEAIYERLRDLFEPRTGDEQDLVLADFCLPYLCCSECVCSTTVVIPPPPVTLSLPATLFCANDRTAYPVTARPEGGTLLVNGTATSELSIIPAQFPGAHTVTLEYRLGNQSAKLDLSLVAPPQPEFRFEPLKSTDDGTLVRFFNITQDVVDESFWTFDKGAPEQTIDDRQFDRLFPDQRVYEVTLRTTRGPCKHATVTREVDLRERVPPKLTFDPGQLDTLLADGQLREVLAGHDPNLIANVSSINARAADASTDPSARERLNTRAAEKEIGAAAQSLFESIARILIDQAGTFSNTLRDRAWAFGQVPISATLFLAGLRTRDLTDPGEIVKAFSVLNEILARLRQTPHGSKLAFGDELAALLDATSADAAKPVLNELSRRTAATMPRVTVVKASVSKKRKATPGKTRSKPASRTASKKTKR